jgi:3-oxoadipate enol-lactonase
MPYAHIDDGRLHYRTDGDPDRPCLVLSNSLGTDLDMWDAQAAPLAEAFHVVRYDTRGHGGSGRGNGPAGIARLGRDVLGLLDHLGIARAHFCGISMGGLTGQWLGVHAPQRIDRLVLANTAARIGTPEGWAARAALVRVDGMGGVADGAAARWFTESFIAGRPPVVRHLIECLREQDAEGYAACCDALSRCDLREQARAIANPTLVIAGRHDPVTTVADGEWLAGQVAGARLAVLEASHLSNIEAAEAFTALLRRFLEA